MKNSKKLLSLFLAVVMIFSMISVVASAYTVGPEVSGDINIKYTVEKADVVPETAAGSAEYTADNIYAVTVWMQSNKGVDTLTAPLHFNKAHFSPIMLFDGEVTYPLGAGFGADDYYENMQEGALYAYAEGDYLLNTGMYKATGATATTKALAKCIGLGNSNSEGVTIIAELVSPDHPLYSKWGAGLPADTGVMYVNLDVAGKTKTAYLNTISGITTDTGWNRMFTFYFETLPGVTEADIVGDEFGVYTDNCFTVDGTTDDSLSGYFVSATSYIPGNPNKNVVSNAVIESAAPACTHENTTITWGDDTATCTEAGTQTGTCECGETVTRDTVALGHDLDEGVVTTDPTCTEDGVKTFSCSRCDYTETETVAKLGHKYDAVVTAPTCTAKGYTTYTCSACGDSYVADETEMVAHTPAAAVEENRTDATCGAAGSYDSVVYCSVCNTELSRDTVTVGKLPHTPAAAVEENRVESTCTVPGSYESVVYCSVCGEEISRETKALELAAHTEGAVVVENNVAPTCTAEGSYDNVVYCTVCNAELSRNTVTVDKIAHTEAAAVEENRVESTCTVAGSYDSVVYCSVCGEELSRETKALELAAHTEGAVVVENEVAATCTAEGSYDNVVYCTVCNAELSRDTVTVDKIDHAYDAVVTAPTCTAKGYTTYTCSACGDSYVADYTEKVDHSYEATVVDPTYGADGSTTYTCTVCGDTYSEVIPALKLAFKHAGSQISFNKNGGAYAGTFNVRAVAAIRKADFEAAFGADGAKITSAGFVFAAGSNVAAPDMAVVKAMVEEGAKNDDYTKYEVSKISTTMVKNAYAFTCLVKDIPDAEKTDSLVVVGYVAWDSNGDGAADSYAYYDSAKTVSFAELYDAYYPW